MPKQTVKALSDALSGLSAVGRLKAAAVCSLSLFEHAPSLFEQSSLRKGHAQIVEVIADLFPSLRSLSMKMRQSASEFSVAPAAAKA